MLYCMHGCTFAVAWLCENFLIDLFSIFLEPGISFSTVFATEIKGSTF